jgi:DNA-directed RNA polymerase
MSNIKMIRKQTKTTVIKNSKPITILIPTDNIDHEKIKSGLMPNFIHSLDATNIHLLIKNINKIQNNKNINLYTIHDCFATDYKSMALIELLVKKSFIDIYFNENYMELIHKSFINQIEEITEIYIEKNKLEGDKLYVLLPKKIKTNKKLKKAENIKYLNNENEIREKIYIPNLPDFNFK